ncbi:MAG: hypothetical protein DI585_02400 [Pseudomonas fluorescens]|nr:MAG: hypothetical protein DI585_02400 [Pseudomonas fluorescens]
MLKEIGLAGGLASNLLGGVLDMFKKDKKGGVDEATGAEQFGSLMAGGMQIATLPAVAPAEEDKAASGAAKVDRLGAGVQEALDALHEMTKDGLEGAMRWAMKEIREDVMESMGVSEDELAAMDPAARDAMEQKIDEEVQKRMAEAMGKDGQDAVAETNALSPEQMVMGIQKALQAEANKAYREEVPTV